jgi:hypothetical protein
MSSCVFYMFMLCNNVTVLKSYGDPDIDAADAQHTAQGLLLPGEVSLHKQLRILHNM